MEVTRGNAGLYMEGADLISTSQIIYLPSDFLKGLKIVREIFLMQNGMQPVEEHFAIWTTFPTWGWGSVGGAVWGRTGYKISYSQVYLAYKGSHVKGPSLMSTGDDWDILGPPLAVLGATSESFYELWTLQSEPRLMPVPLWAWVFNPAQTEEYLWSSHGTFWK